MTCPGCGNLNDNNDKFCKKCGTNLNNNIQNQVEQNVSNSEMSTNNNGDNGVNVGKKKFNKKIIFLSVGGVSLVSVIILCVVLFGGKSNLENNDINNSSINNSYEEIDREPFFLMNDDGKYALFSVDGDQMSDFVYSYGGEFLYGTALVTNDKDQDAIISSSGKILVDFDENSRLYRRGPFYERSYDNLLINTNGETLYDLDNYDILNYNSFDAMRHLILEDKINNKYIVLNHLNEKLLEIPLVEGVDEIEECVTDGWRGRYVTFFYNNINYIFDLVSNKKIISFEDNEKYCIIRLTKDKNIYLLEVSDGYYGYDEFGKNKVVIGTSVYDAPSTCEEVNIKNGNLICSGDGLEYRLTLKEGSNVLETNLAMSFLDINNYIKDNESGGVDFYSNGKLVKHVPCRKVASYGYSAGGVYALSFASGKGCKYVNNVSYYDKNGEKLFEEEFIDGTNFDENGFASVMTIDKKYYDDRWYLIDKKGNKVSDLYFSIEYDDGLYSSYNDGNLYGYYDENGKEIIPCKYNNALISTSGIRKLIILQNAEYKYEVYNPEIKEIILTLDEMPTMLDDYIIVDKDDKKLYYSYNGKLMYQS